jgi:hypothetical protein
VALGLWALPSLARPHRLQRAALALCTEGPLAGALSMCARAEGHLAVSVSVHDGRGELCAELHLSYAVAEPGAPSPGRALLPEGRAEAVRQGELGMRLQALPSPFGAGLLPGDLVPMSLEGYALQLAPGPLQGVVLEVVQPVAAGEEVLLVAEQGAGACQVRLSTRHGLVGTAILALRSP